MTELKYREDVFIMAMSEMEFIKAFRAASPAKRYAITAVIEEMNGKNPTAVDINALYQQKYTEYMEKELEAHTTE